MEVVGSVRTPYQLNVAIRHVAARRSYRTITNLPPELLHMIFSYLRPWPYYVKPITLTCRTLREVAVEYLKFRAPYVRELTPFLSFTRRHRPIATNIQSLELAAGTNLDATLVKELRQLFPKLVELRLMNISCPTSARTQAQSEGPLLRLELLKVTCFYHIPRTGWSLCGMMHILSLLAPKTLIVWVDSRFKFKGQSTFDSRCIVAPSPTNRLQVRYGDDVSKDTIAQLFDGLSNTLAQDTLEYIEVMYNSKETLHALGRMLDRNGRNVTALMVQWSASWSLDQRLKCADPLDDQSLLDIRKCPILESLEIPIYTRPRRPGERTLSHVGVGILLHYASPTLRKVTIHLHDLERPTTLGNRALLKLQEFDRVITQARFPLLEKFQLTVGVTQSLRRKYGYEEKCAAAAIRALPGLHARGVLTVNVQSWF